MTYSVKEIFLSVQGEGAHTGRVSVFIRFSGCNLWSGREKDRANAVCKFCDTQFVGTDGLGGGQFKTAALLADEVLSYWPMNHDGKHDDRDGEKHGEKWVICTGGEPLLQLDAPLITALHAAGFKVAVETNGTLKAPSGIDWLCVSPKADAKLVQVSGDEIKLVYPQIENKPEDFAHLDFQVFSLQPLDNKKDSKKDNKKDNEKGDEKDDTQDTMRAAFNYCLKHPNWHLSLQTHKYLGVR
ncbi:MAG: 7-carboxy-7-deazaguanine synthase [Robiginitomaculum sp.]|nr:7-carboxy-7-deazaguanine synthase [Robiginitomaculum sp.]